MKESGTLPPRATLGLGLVAGLSAAVPLARAQTPAPAITTPGGMPAASQPRHLPSLDPGLLARWGVSGRVVRGKIPTLNVVVDAAKILSAWPQIRAAGLVGTAADGVAADGASDDRSTGWARAHPVAACNDVALAALPLVLHDLYRADNALDYAPVYVFCTPAEVSAAPQPLFSLNVNRAIVRKLRGGAEFGARVAFSPWLTTQLRQEPR
jgi:hypothetical protein